MNEPASIVASPCVGELSLGITGGLQSLFYGIKYPIGGTGSHGQARIHRAPLRGTFLS